MPGPDGKKERVSRPDLDDPPAGTAEREPCDAREDAERLMGGRVIMMIVENRVAPLRRPVMIGEQRLESLRGFLALGAAGAAINFDRQSLIVRQRSEERRVGNACVCACSSRGLP